MEKEQINKAVLETLAEKIVSLKDALGKAQGQLDVARVQSEHYDKSLSEQGAKVSSLLDENAKLKELSKVQLDNIEQLRNDNDRMKKQMEESKKENELASKLWEVMNFCADHKLYISIRPTTLNNRSSTDYWVQMYSSESYEPVSGWHSFNLLSVLTDVANNIERAWSKRKSKQDADEGKQRSQEQSHDDAEAESCITEKGSEE